MSRVVRSLSAVAASGGGGGTTITDTTDRVPFLAASTAVAWTNMPLAEQEFLGNQNRRLPYLGTGKTEIRLTVGGAVVGAAAAVLRLKYSTNGGGAFTAVTSSDVSIAAIGTAVQPITSGWVTLPVGARVDGILSVFGQGGDGVADPTFTLVEAELR